MNASSWMAVWRYAAEVHDGQCWPGSGLPYLTHLGQVALLLLQAHQQQAVPDVDLAVCCAILHDSIEDRQVTHAELAGRFGLAVADGVLALSKTPELDKAAAMADSLARIRQQPAAVWCVKLADRIANLQPPPAHWSREKCLAYQAEARQILAALGEAHPLLAEWLGRAISEYRLGAEG